MGAPSLDDFFFGPSGSPGPVPPAKPKAAQNTPSPAQEAPYLLPPGHSRGSRLSLLMRRTTCRNCGSVTESTEALGRRIVRPNYTGWENLLPGMLEEMDYRNTPVLIEWVGKEVPICISCAKF